MRTLVILAPVRDQNARGLSGLLYKVSGDVNRYDHRLGHKQAGDLFRLMTPSQKKALIGNLAGHMKGIPERIARLQDRALHESRSGLWPQCCGSVGAGG